MLDLEETPTLRRAAGVIADRRAPDRRAADRVLHAATRQAVADIRAGHDPYWTLLHAGLAVETLIGGVR